MEKEIPKDENQLMLDALKRLRSNADFITWREAVAKPLITQWENELTRADDLPEIILRAKLYQINTLKALFYTWFEAL